MVDSEAGEEESRCSSELVTMLHEEVILTKHTGAAISPAFPAILSPPPCPHTHTHTPKHPNAHHRFISKTTLAVLLPSSAPPPPPSHRPASHTATAYHSPPRRSYVTWGSAVSSGKANTLRSLPSTAPLRGVTRPTVCHTRREITTHLLLLSAWVSDEQKRPLADANCRGVEGGVCVRGVRWEERRKCKERERVLGGKWWLVVKG